MFGTREPIIWQLLKFDISLSIIYIFRTFMCIAFKFKE